MLESVSLADIIGNLAALLTTISFLPQTVKTLKTRNTEGISFFMYLLFSTGVACWLVYGILLENLPIILANMITLPLALTVLIIKIINIRKYHKGSIPL